MRRATCVSACVLLLCLVRGVAFAGPSGFPGLQWGDPAQRMATRQAIGRHADMVLYTREKDMAEYEGISIQGIVYAFQDNELVAVMMLVAESPVARQQLIKRHGTAAWSDDERGIHGLWRSGDTAMMLVLFTQGGPGALVLFDVRFLPQEGFVQQLGSALSSIQLTETGSPEAVEEFPCSCGM